MRRLLIALTCVVACEATIQNRREPEPSPAIVEEEEPARASPAAPTGPPACEVYITSCADDRPVGGFDANDWPFGEYTGDCKDSDCTDGLNGRCNPMIPAGSDCSYDECIVDSDCPAGNVCLCRGVFARHAGTRFESRWASNYCASNASAHCRSDADCPGSTCGLSVDQTTWGAYCHTAADECATSADCDSQTVAPLCEGYPNDAIVYRGVEPKRCLYSETRQLWACL